MAYFNICPECGAYLDPGEPCDCKEEQEKQSEFYSQIMRADHRTGQYSLILDRRELSNVTKIAN